mgnify:CR=1 FL=1
MSEPSCPSLNILCREYLDHLDQISNMFEPNYHYVSFHTQRRLGLYDHHWRKDQGLIQVKNMIIEHLKNFIKENNFRCLLTLSDCKRVSSIYYNCFSIIIESEKSSMIKYSNWWDKKGLKLAVFNSPLTSLNNYENFSSYYNRGDAEGLDFEECNQRDKIIQKENDHLTILDITLKEIEYWTDLENFWVFLGASFPRNCQSQLLLALLSICDLKKIISSFIFQRKDSFDEVQFYSCYRLSFQFLKEFQFVQKGRDIDGDHLVIPIRKLGDRKIRRKFPKLWAHDPRTARQLAMETINQDEQKIQNRLLTLEQIYSGTV